MGNVCQASSAEDWSAHRERRDSITVLQGNGEVLELRREVRAEELMREHPNHFLCHASSILLRKKSKMIQPKTRLQQGAIYLLLPFPGKGSPDSESSEKEESPAVEDPLLEPVSATASTPGTTKFVISKHYLDRILSEKSSTMPLKKKSSTRSSSSSPRRRLQQRKIMRRVDCSSRSSGVGDSNAQAPVQRKTTISWAPELDSIPEK